MESLAISLAAVIALAVFMIASDAVLRRFNKEVNLVVAGVSTAVYLLLVMTVSLLLPGPDWLFPLIALLNFVTAFLVTSSHLLSTVSRGGRFVFDLVLHATGRGPARPTATAAGDFGIPISPPVQAAIGALFMNVVLGFILVAVGSDAIYERATSGSLAPLLIDAVRALVSLAVFVGAAILGGALAPKRRGVTS